MPEPLLSTGLMMAGYTAVVALSRSCSAVSAEAEVVRSNASVVIEQVNRSVALFGPKAELLSRLFVLAEECRDANWDGYGSEPVKPRAVQGAAGAIASLPEDISLPDCSVEPDGCISLDWMPGTSRILSVTIGESDRLPYAWVDGTDRGHAVAKCADQQLPPRVLAEIRRFARHDASVVRVA